MNIPFVKYQGTGNDFVIIDQTKEQYLAKNRDESIIKRICNRRFGIGADGLMLLEKDNDSDFRMIYFNSDGSESTMCGNGGRCIFHFAHTLGLVGNEGLFVAIDGLHKAKIVDTDIVSLQMQEVHDIHVGNDFYTLDTGSPHYVTFVQDVSDLDVKTQGAAIRYAVPFRKKGINVNFVEPQESGLAMATYERGVEDETLSCGTGVTAAALAYAFKQNIADGNHEIGIQAKGGNLKVSFHYDGKIFTNVWLEGPAVAVFEGVYKL